MENDKLLGQLNMMLMRQSEEIRKLRGAIEWLEKKIYQNEQDDKQEKRISSQEWDIRELKRNIKILLRLIPPRGTPEYLEVICELWHNRYPNERPLADENFALFTKYEQDLFGICDDDEGS